MEKRESIETHEGPSRDPNEMPGHVCNFVDEAGEQCGKPAVGLTDKNERPVHGFCREHEAEVTAYNAECGQ